MQAEIYTAVVVTAELLGYEITPNAARAMSAELDGYPLGAVLAALKRCARECRGRLTLADVIAKLPGAHPEPNEAWALASSAADEDATVVWSPEMAIAFDGVRGILADGDQYGARTAFVETYRRLVAESPSAIADWEVSMGHSVAGRAMAIRRAVELGRLPPSRAEKLLPPAQPELRALPTGDAPEPEMLRALLAQVKGKS